MSGNYFSSPVKAPCHEWLFKECPNWWAKFLFCIFNFYESSCWRDGSTLQIQFYSPGYTQEWILSPLACLVLNTGFHSLYRLTRDLQMNETQVAFIINRLQGWDSGEEKWGRAAKFGVSVNPRSLCVIQRQAPCRSQLCPVCSALAIFNSPLK